MLLAATCIFILSMYVTYVGIFHPRNFFHFTLPIVFIAAAGGVVGLIFLSFYSLESALVIVEILDAIFATW